MDITSYLIIYLKIFDQILQGHEILSSIVERRRHNIGKDGNALITYFAIFPRQISTQINIIRMQHDN